MSKVFFSEPRKVWIGYIELDKNIKVINNKKLYNIAEQASEM